MIVIYRLHTFKISNLHINLDKKNRSSSKKLMSGQQYTKKQWRPIGRLALWRAKILFAPLKAPRHVHVHVRVKRLHLRWVLQGPQASKS
jgi:hypothetical protein